MAAVDKEMFEAGRKEPGSPLGLFRDYEHYEQHVAEVAARLEQYSMRGIKGKRRE